MTTPASTREKDSGVRADSPGYWAIVPAAGVGSRMQSELPKQYLPVLGKTVMEHTLERLFSVEAIKGVVVSVSRQDQHWHRLPVAGHDKIMTVHGGQERMHSVYNALTYLEKEQGVLTDFVLVHDAVRPCVMKDDISRLINTVGEDQIGGILATPLVDTLKRVDTANRIVETVPRDACWRAQTPQMFRLELLRKCLELLFNRQQLASDEAAAIEAAGFQPLVVQGCQHNMKLTVPDDLPLMEAILASQSNRDQTGGSYD